jgi:hypothetical protein
MNKNVSLHFTINMKKYMLVELFASSYATFDGLVNGAWHF